MGSNQAAILTINKAEFKSEYLRGRFPVLVVDGLSDWPALECWTPEYLNRIAGDCNVDAGVSSTGSFRYKPNGTAADPEKQFDLANIPFKKIADSIASDPSGAKYYVAQLDIKSRLPQLLPDLRFPSPPTYHTLRLWYGSAGTITPLHFDRTNNLYAQIYGAKQFSIFCPDDTPNLYPFQEGPLSHLSYIDVGSPQWDCYPLYGKVKPIEFTVCPGQLLFLPAFWWHYVKSDNPAGLRQLRTAFSQDKWAEIKSTWGLSSRALLDYAESARSPRPSLAVLATAVAMLELSEESVNRALADSRIEKSWETIVSLAQNGGEWKGEFSESKFRKLVGGLRILLA
jgi:hypothetical protein